MKNNYIIRIYCTDLTIVEYNIISYTPDEAITTALWKFEDFYNKKIQSYTLQRIFT